MKTPKKIKIPYMKYAKGIWICLLCLALITDVGGWLIMFLDLFWGWEIDWEFMAYSTLLFFLPVAAIWAGLLCYSSNNLRYTIKEDHLFHAYSCLHKKLCTVDTTLPTYYAIHDIVVLQRVMNPFIILSNKPFLCTNCLAVNYNAKKLIVMAYKEKIIPPSELEKWNNVKELYPWDVCANGKRNKLSWLWNRPMECEILSLETVDRRTTATVRFVKSGEVMDGVLVLDSQVSVGMRTKAQYIQDANGVENPNGYGCLVLHGWIIPADSQEL